jgi:hypothetical protein
MSKPERASSADVLLGVVDSLNTSLPQAEGICRVAAFNELHDLTIDPTSIANALFAAADLLVTARMAVGVLDHERQQLLKRATDPRARRIAAKSREDRAAPARELSH